MGHLTTERSDRGSFSLGLNSTSNLSSRKHVTGSRSRFVSRDMVRPELLQRQQRAEALRPLSAQLPTLSRGLPEYLQSTPRNISRVQRHFPRHLNILKLHYAENGRNATDE